MTMPMSPIKQVSPRRSLGPGHQTGNPVNVRLPPDHSVGVPTLRPARMTLIE